MQIFEGSAVAIVTPMNQDGSVNFDQLNELVAWHLTEGTDAIVACGTTGEAATLTTKEQGQVIEAVVKKVNGQVPVIAGAGSNNTAHAIELASQAEQAGVDGLLVVTPYYNKTSAAGLILHYQAIAHAVKLPIILYSVASRTGMNITPAQVKELAQIENIIGIKEASGNLSQVAEIAALVPDFAIYSGNDDQVVPVMALGGKGVISTAANVVPKAMHDLTTAMLNGDWATARTLQLDLLPLIHALFKEVNPIPVKEAVALLGKLEANYRLPLTQPTAETIEELHNELLNYGLEV